MPGTGVPPAVRPAATVILLRDAPAGLEVWLLRRVRTLAFAGGASVFPGGRVDPGDYGEPAASLTAGADAGRLADRFGCSVEQARASTMAAIRETFEETGVLLTRPAVAVETALDVDVDTVLDADVGSGGHWLQEQRRRVEAHELEFSALLVRLRLAVDADLIRPWARWITPVGEPRRFDTHFYVAALPAGATAHPETSEATDAGWSTPAAALTEYGRGQRPMLAPTVVCLEELTGFARVDDVLAASEHRSLVPVAPELLTTADGRTVARLPGGRRLPLSGVGPAGGGGP